MLALVLLPPLAGFLGGEDAARGGSVWSALLLTLGKVGAFIAVMLVIGRRGIPWLLERVAGSGSRELFTLCVLAIALGVAFGSAALFGVSFALGAFFAGMMLNESEFSHQAASETLPLRDAFAVLFFVSVGMLFNPMILVEQPLQVLGTFVIIVVAKSAVAWYALRALGTARDGALAIAASLAQIGEFSFILAGLAVQLDILPSAGQDLILAGALLSIVANPLILGWIDRRHAATTQKLPAEDADAGAPPVPSGIQGHVILIGYGRVGSELAGLLLAREVPLVVIEGEDHMVERSRALGIPTVRGNAANDRVLHEARPERAQTAMVAIPNALEAGEIIARLRQIKPDITILARAHSDAEVKHLLEHGADGAVMAERELAHSLAEMVLATPHFRGAASLPSVSH